MACTDWWLMGSHRPEAGAKMEDEVTSDCEARTGTAVLKPLLWSIVGNFYWKPDSYFEKWRLLSHNNNCKVQYWWGRGLGLGVHTMFSCKPRCLYCTLYDVNNMQRGRRNLTMIQVSTTAPLHNIKVACAMFIGGSRFVVWVVTIVWGN